MARPPDRSASTAQATISPPNASTAGQHRQQRAARGQDVVDQQRPARPGAIVKPRRNSRRVVPSAAVTSSAKMLRTPSWRAVSKARTTPPVVGPATRSTAGVAVGVSMASPPRSRRARSSRPGPAGPGTSRDTARSACRSSAGSGRPSAPRIAGTVPPCGPRCARAAASLASDRGVVMRASSRVDGVADCRAVTAGTPRLWPTAPRCASAGQSR